MDEAAKYVHDELVGTKQGRCRYRQAHLHVIEDSPRVTGSRTFTYARYRCTLPLYIGIFVPGRAHLAEIVLRAIRDIIGRVKCHGKSCSGPPELRHNQ